MTVQILSLQLRDDGSIRCPQDTSVQLEAIASQLGEDLDRPVSTYAVAAAMVALNSCESRGEMEFSDAVEWVLNRQEEFDHEPIPAAEIRSISQTGKFPLVKFPRIRFEVDGLSAPIDACSHFQRLAYALQNELDLPVEPHHVVYALIALLKPGSYILGKELDLTNTKTIKQAAKILQHQYDKDGQLLQVKDGEE